MKENRLLSSFLRKLTLSTTRNECRLAGASACSRKHTSFTASVLASNWFLLKKQIICPIFVACALSYMKGNSLYVVFSFFLFLSSLKTFAQADQQELGAGYYTVVAVYAESREELAMLYVKKLVARGYDAKYGFNTSRKLYYVYLEYFTNLREAVDGMMNTRKKGVFTDAWIRVIPGDIKKTGTVWEEPAPEKEQAMPTDKDNDRDTSAVVAVPARAERINKNETPLKQDEKGVLESGQDLSAESAEVEERVSGPKDEPAQSRTGLQGVTMFLNLFNATNNRIIDGEVKVIDTERARLISRVKGNEELTLPSPKSESGEISLIAEVFGYRKIQHEINYNTLLADTVKSYVDLVGNTLVVLFDMVRYRKGDIVTLYNVYFYNDAAIMLPESKYELNSLLQLMQENPDYRILLHGHSNGNYYGKVIISGPGKNFFSLNGDVKEHFGSAKELSGQRANAIKEYLAINGIDPSRIEIKAWGGKRPLYDKNSANAKRNVRVEVEILQD